MSVQLHHSFWQQRWITVSHHQQPVNLQADWFHTSAIGWKALFE